MKTDENKISLDTDLVKEVENVEAFNKKPSIVVREITTDCYGDIAEIIAIHSDSLATIEEKDFFLEKSLNVGKRDRYASIFALIVDENVVGTITVVNGSPERLITGPFKPGEKNPYLICAQEGHSEITALSILKEWATDENRLLLLEVAKDYAQDRNESYALVYSSGFDDDKDIKFFKKHFHMVHHEIWDVIDSSGRVFSAFSKKLEEFAPDEYVINPDGTVNEEEFELRKMQAGILKDLPSSFIQH